MSVYSAFSISVETFVPIFRNIVFFCKLAGMSCSTEEKCAGKCGQTLKPKDLERVLKRRGCRNIDEFWDFHVAVIFKKDVFRNASAPDCYSSGNISRKGWPYLFFRNSSTICFSGQARKWKTLSSSRALPQRLKRQFCSATQTQKTLFNASAHDVTALVVSWRLIWVERNAWSFFVF